MECLGKVRREFCSRVTTTLILKNEGGVVLHRLLSRDDICDKPSIGLLIATRKVFKRG